MAVSAIGTKLQRFQGSFRNIAEVLNIGGPGAERSFLEATSLDSTGGYREFIAGFRDAGEVRFSANYIGTSNGNPDEWPFLFSNDFSVDTVQLYRILFADTSNLQFNGNITAMPLNISTDGVITSDIVARLTGAFTWTPV